MSFSCPHIQGLWMIKVFSDVAVSKDLLFSILVSVFSPCDCSCHSFPLNPSYCLSQLSLSGFLTFTDHVLWPCFSFLSWSRALSKQELLLIFFLLWKAHLSQVFSHHFFVNDLPTDPWVHRVPHFSLFSNGDTLWPPLSGKDKHWSLHFLLRLVVLTNRTFSAALTL